MSSLLWRYGLRIIAFITFSIILCTGAPMCMNSKDQFCEFLQEMSPQTSGIECDLYDEEDLHIIFKTLSSLGFFTNPYGSVFNIPQGLDLDKILTEVLAKGRMANSGVTARGATQPQSAGPSRVDRWGITYHLPRYNQLGKPDYTHYRNFANAGQKQEFTSCDREGIATFAEKFGSAIEVAETIRCQALYSIHLARNLPVMETTDAAQKRLRTLSFYGTE